MSDRGSRTSATRRIANEGVAVAELGGDVLGLAVWIVIGVFFAIRLFSWSDSAKATPRA